MPWYYRQWPPPVYQKDKFACWAAALESWIRATHRPVKAKTQDEWLGILDAETDANGGLSSHGVGVMAQMLGMGMKVYGAGATPSMETMSSRLRAYGHLFLIFSWLGIGHAQVIFGVNESERRLAFMDPDPIEGTWGTRLLEDYFSESGEYIVGWAQYAPKKKA